MKDPPTPATLHTSRRSLTARVVHGYSPLGVDAQEVLLPPTRFCVRSLHRYSDSAIWHGTSAVPQLETLSAEGWAIHTTDNRVPQVVPQPRALWRVRAQVR